MKKTLILLLTFTLLTGPLVQPLAVSANEFEYWYTYENIDIQAALEEERELTEEEFYYFVDLLEEYISYEEGEIIIEGNFESLNDILDDEIINQMVDGVEYLNELADEGELVITPNGTIYEYDDDKFTLQSGGRNRTTRHWWGTRTYTCRDRTTRWANDFGLVSQLATGAALAAGRFGLKKAAFLSGVTAVYFGVLSQAMHRRNTGHSRGIRVSMPWVPLGFTTARQ